MKVRIKGYGCEIEVEFPAANLIAQTNDRLKAVVDQFMRLVNEAKEETK